MKINPEVEKFLEKKKHPLDAEIRRVREIILSADERVEEEESVRLAADLEGSRILLRGGRQSLIMRLLRPTS
jgi:hypothetical protein